MKSKVCCLLILLWCHWKLNAQAPLVRNIWPNNTHTPAKVNVLSFHPKGYLLLAQDQGLFKYNGNSFVRIGSNSNIPVTALSKYNSGKLWIGYKDGSYGYLQNDSLVRSSLQALTAGHEIKCIEQSDSQTLWLGTDNGLFLLRNDVLRKFDISDGLSDNFVYSVVVLNKNTLLVATDQGINRITLDASGNIKVSIHATFPKLKDDIVSAMSLFSNRTVLLGVQKGTIGKYDLNTHEIAEFKSAKSGWGQITSFLKVSSYKAYAATVDGYVLTINLQTDSITICHKFENEKPVYDLLKDSAGNIWAATQSGISMLTSEYLNQIILPQPYRISDVTALAIAPDKTIWLALNSKLFTFSFTAGLQLIHRFSSKVSTLYIDDDGGILVGTSANGIWLKKNKNGNFLQPLPIDTKNDGVLYIAGDKNDLWVAGLSGVKEYSLDGYKVLTEKLHDKKEGISSDYVYQILIQKNNTVWLASDGAGISKYTQGKYRHWRNLNSGTDAVVYTVAEAADGSIWAGTMANNIYRYYNEKWELVKQYDRGDGANSLTTIMGNNIGQQFCVYSNRIEVWDTSRQNICRFHGNMDVGIDTFSEALNCVAKDAEGNIYIPSNKGILVFGQIQVSRFKDPKVVLERILVNQKQVEEGITDFKPGENYFSFYFDAVSLGNAEAMQYRYKLDGYSKDWIYTKEPQANFSKLPWGNYNFIIQASISNDFKYATQANYAFTIHAPFYSKLWFILLSAVMLIALIFTIVRINNRRIARIARLKEEKLRFEFDYLRSQVNPHFLFNSLNTLTGLIEDDSERAMLYTERLSDLYRHSLQSYTKDKASLSEEVALLQAYIYIQEARFGKALDITIDIPENVKQKYYLPAMTLQLVVENALKHNVVAQAHPLQLLVQLQNDCIIVRNKINLKITKEASVGIGLKNIERRYKMLGNANIEYGAVNNWWVVKLPLLN